jgi:hydrogenase nickel incorporation protein HypA/HybF
VHELSIAQNIVDIVHQYVPENDCRTVKAVKIQVGTMAGIVADSLEFCFSAINAGTLLAGAALEIERVPFTIECSSCNEISTNDAGTLQCPACGGMETRVLSGTEMNVLEIELHDEPVEAL